MRAITIGVCLAAVGACGDVPTTTSVPNLFGVVTTAISDRPTQAALSRISEWRAPDAACIGNSFGAIEVSGDVLGRDGATQTVLASYDHLLVVGSDGALIAATTTGFDCAGSSDAIEIVALGRTWLDTPVIAVAATTGGHSEHVTTVALYRVRDRELVQVFAGTVLAREGPDTWVGSISVVPDGIVYRAPGDPVTLWTFDRSRGAYVPRGVPAFPRT